MSPCIVYLENTSLTIANDPYFDEHGYICPVGSYNGLLCLLTFNNAAEYWFYLWNPATRKEVRVLRIGDNVWRSIQCFPDAQVSISRTGVYVNGSLNWLTIPKQSQFDYGYSAKTLTINQFGIISLDLNETIWSSRVMDSIAQN
ncbi:F-box protein [Trifolium pratense]|uniref:F-box protein n=1 Tax=Trifolium pratense TaxID=57577 RepID=A0A2K3PMD2_TRIPR|nr:F-box protein [Trifolium pratense]